ncbi:hypothetical protein [Paracoccus sp. T5]|uniref:hypothetical protein n=1 Tax=Paracoccus sp. T5 TaxID=3402161 RepID=UPI003AEEAC02
MADALIAAIEPRDQMPPPSNLRAAMELLVMASAVGVVDPDVLRARQRLAGCLAAKPSTTLIQNHARARGDGFGR